MNGTDFKNKIANKTGIQREMEIIQAINSNILPSFLKPDNFVEITISRNQGVLRYFVARDYFSIGTDDDYLLTPCTPVTLREFLKTLQCSLPTPTMVDQIYRQANYKIPAKPQKPMRGESITSSRLYFLIDDAIKNERKKRNIPQDALVAGHKKDVVLTNALTKKENKGNVAIYGWYYSNGQRIQNLNSKDHKIDYVDYSHGLRFVSNKCFLNGRETTLQAIFTDPINCLFVHDEPLRFLNY
jgi:hypothetical protein